MRSERKVSRSCIFRGNFAAENFRSLFQKRTRVFLFYGDFYYYAIAVFHVIYYKIARKHRKLFILRVRKRYFIKLRFIKGANIRAFKRRNRRAAVRTGKPARAEFYSAEISYDDCDRLIYALTFKRVKYGLSRRAVGFAVV